MHRHSLMAVALVTAVGPASAGCATTAPSLPEDALGVSELRSASLRDDAPLLAAPVTVTATDGVALAVRFFAPESPRAAIVFVHGGGAHGAAGYPLFASALAARGIAVALPDLRGHGASGGPRGDTPSSAQMEDDLRTIIEATRQRFPSVSVFVGGHSSGAGLVLNTARTLKDVAGIVWVAPHLGFRSETSTEHARAFANVDVWRFVVNSMSAGVLCAHDDAVHFAYDPALLKRDPLMVKDNTVAMANALTPRAPGDQLEAVRPPLFVAIAAHDALIDATLLAAFIKEHAPQATVTSVDASHLGVLLHASDAAAEFVLANAAAAH